MAELHENACGLAERECIPCKGGIPPLRGPELQSLLSELGGGWRVVEGKRLAKEYRFKDFREAMHFANKVAALADRVNHHPDITIGWGKAQVVVWTHKIGGLSETDFVLAAKVDAL